MNEEATSRQTQMRQNCSEASVVSRLGMGTGTTSEICIYNICICFRNM